MKKVNTRMLVSLAMLVGIEVVLSRFCSFSVWNMKIGFGFVPIVAAAILYGAVPAGIAAALADFLGAVLFPIGAYFPGFTLTAFLTGAVFGIFLHRKQNWPDILPAVAINQLILSLFLNTLWISVLYGSPYWPLVVTRLIQCAVMAPVQFVVTGLLAKALSRYRLSGEA